REHRQFSEHLRKLQSQIETHQSTQRRSTQAGVLWPGERAIALVDKRDQFFDQHVSVKLRLAAAQLYIAGRGVFLYATLASVVNAGDDQRLDLAALDKLIGSLIGAPLGAAESSLGVEQILAVL